MNTNQMKDKFLRISTDVFGDEINAWLNNTKALTYEQKEELILKGETIVQRTDSSYTSYQLVEKTDQGEEQQRLKAKEIIKSLEK